MFQQYHDAVTHAQASETAKKLADHGLDVEPTKEDKDVAAKITMAYADDPDTTSKKVTTKK